MKLQGVVHGCVRFTEERIIAGAEQLARLIEQAL
jgi:hypothetical protein